MKWNKAKGYIIQTKAEITLKDFLGINTLDYFVDKNTEPLLIPYYTYIMEFLNQKFVVLGINAEIKTKLHEFNKIFKYGAYKIANDATLDLVRNVGIVTDNETEDDWNIVFNQDRFVFAWTNFMTALWMRLKFQYANLFVKNVSDNDCCKCYASGQTESDYESWSSKVFPHDELYDRSNFEGDRSHNSWGTIVDRYCDCYRKE